jgi:hypothetical protein
VKIEVRNVGFIMCFTLIMASRVIAIDPTKQALRKQILKITLMSSTYLLILAKKDRHDRRQQQQQLHLQAPTAPRCGAQWNAYSRSSYSRWPTKID